jgi:hypothetical protein
MQVPKLLLMVALLNLAFLFAEIAMNVLGVMLVAFR